MSFLISALNSRGALGGGRWRSLSCPSYCNDDAEPVCGSDGVLYKNDCDRRKRTCGTGNTEFICKLSFFHFNFPARKIQSQISSNHVGSVTGNTDNISPSLLFNFPAKNDCNQRKTHKLICRLGVYISLSLFLFSF